MNEAIVNEMTAIGELNRVEGFDPRKFMRRLTEPDENGQPAERLYLEVAYRKLWFRLKHPEGASLSIKRRTGTVYEGTLSQVDAG